MLQKKCGEQKQKQNLLVLPEKYWPKLRDLFKIDWPQHILSFYTLQNFISWMAKDPQLTDIKIYTADSNWRKHGTFIVKDRSQERYNVIFHSLSATYNELMLSSLRCLEYEPAYTLVYMEQTRPVAEQHLREMGITDLLDGYCPTVLYHLPKEESLQLELNPVEGFVVKPLTADCVDQVNNLWLHKHPGSDYCIARAIKYNLTFGAYDQNNGKLCAWVLQWEVASIALLHVENDYRRRGLAEHLVRHLCIKLAEAGLDPTAAVMDTNTPSKNLFNKIGFKAVDNLYWFDKVALHSAVPIKRWNS